MRGSRRRLSLRKSDEAAEGKLLPVVVALFILALTGTFLGWLLLFDGEKSFNKDNFSFGYNTKNNIPNSFSSDENKRQEIYDRLRVLKVDRIWFLKLVDASFFLRFPQLGGRFAFEKMDSSIGIVWYELAEEWLAKVEQLPPNIRIQLGNLNDSSWYKNRENLIQKGLARTIVEKIISTKAQRLLAGWIGPFKPDEPFLQLWHAIALLDLEEVEIEKINIKQITSTSQRIFLASRDIRLMEVDLPSDNHIEFKTDGSPLIQIAVFNKRGIEILKYGPLGRYFLAPKSGNKLYILFANEGVASGYFRLDFLRD